jgi:hypothetical protein
MEAKRKPRHHLSEDSHIIARSEQGPLWHLDNGAGRFAAEPVKDSVSAERRAVVRPFGRIPIAVFRIDSQAQRALGASPARRLLHRDPLLIHDPTK